MNLVKNVFFISMSVDYFEFQANAISTILIYSLKQFEANFGYTIVI